jgi:hypothetical protein
VREEGQAVATRRRSAWTVLVIVSGLVVLAVAATLAVWWLVSSQEHVTAYAVRGAPTSITLDLGDADAEIIGGRSESRVEVSRTERFAFGQQANAWRGVNGGVLRLRSRCPSTVLGTCSASYRLTVPSNIPLTVRTGSGDVRLTGFRGSARIATETGDIAARSFCGLLLQAQAASGDVSATAACPPERLEMRSQSGDVHAVVPPGRYRIDADTDEGERSVRGLIAVEDAPFHILALSGAGDVELEARQ